MTWRLENSVIRGELFNLRPVKVWWRSKKGEMLVALLKPRIVFGEENDDKEKKEAAREKDAGKPFFPRVAENKSPDSPDDAEEEAPYALSPPQLEEQLEG